MARKRHLRLIKPLSEVDPIVRQQEFQAAHPEVAFFVTINLCHGANIPGHEPIIRLDLGKLMNALDELYSQTGDNQDGTEGPSPL